MSEPTVAELNEAERVRLHSKLSLIAPTIINVPEDVTLDPDFKIVVDHSTGAQSAVIEVPTAKGKGATKGE